MYKVPEEYRITEQVAGKLTKMFNIDPRNVAHWISGPEVGKQGFFMLPNPRTMKGLYLLCMASFGMQWEHVSISIPTESRTPTWPEMCFVKDLFWDDTDTVVQFHPPKKDYVNAHEFCLHLWRPTEFIIQTPPSILVGPK